MITRIAVVGIVAVIISGCSTSDRTTTPDTPRPPPASTTTTTPPSDRDVDLTRLAADIHAWQVAVWTDAAARARAVEEQRRPERPDRPQRPPSGQAVVSGRCGGPLPPCAVLHRESRGDYGAVNPTGCSGRGCYGAWQFDPRTWSGIVAAHPDLQLPAHPADATPAQQDAAAAALWDGGNGCAHWAAC